MKLNTPAVGKLRDTEELYVSGIFDGAPVVVKVTLCVTLPNANVTVVPLGTVSVLGLNVEVSVA
jgi:hypothetical protein